MRPQHGLIEFPWDIGASWRSPQDRLGLIRKSALTRKTGEPQATATDTPQQESGGDNELQAMSDRHKTTVLIGGMIEYLRLEDRQNGTRRPLR